jgi:PST family polysaccharide transporter
VKRIFVVRLGIDVLARSAMLVLFFVLTRRLGMEGFGRFIWALTLAVTVSQLVESGVQILFFRDLSAAVGGAPPDASRVWGEFAALKGVLSVVVGGIVAGGGAWLWPWRDGGSTVPAMALWAVGNSWADFLNNACNAAGLWRTSAGVLWAHRGLSLAGGVLGAFVSGGAVSSAAWGMAMGSAAGAVFGLWALARRAGWVKPPSFFVPRIWALAKKSAPLGMGGLLANVYFRWGIFLLPHIGDTRQTGLYGAVHKLIESALMVPAALVAVALPALVRASNPEEKARRRKALFGNVLGLGFGVVVAGCAAAPVFVPLAFGDAFVPAAGVLRVLLVSALFGYVNFVFSHFLIVENQSRRYVGSEAIGVTAGFVLTWWGAREWGALGAAWGLVGTEALLTGLLGASVLWKEEKK